MTDQASSSWVIGIDLGTANIRVAVYRHGKVEIIPDADGNTSMPSYIAFNDFGRSVGSLAKSRATSNPKCSIFGVKRFLGRRFAESDVQDDLKYLPFQVVDVHGEPTVKVEHQGETRLLKTVEILSMLLSQAKLNAETYLGTPTSNTVISIPAYFTREQRHAVQDAAEIAGFNVLHMGPAPCAVFMARAFEQRGKEGETNVLTLDIGAGFFNVGLATIEEGIIEVKAVASDPHLGGNDFDSRLLHYFTREAQQRGVDIWSSKRAIQRLRRACETAKRELSSMEKYPVILDSLIANENFESTITRKRFEELCQDLFGSTFQQIDRVLADAKMDKSQVHEIIVVGGSSRIPRLRTLWEDYFNGKAVSRSMNPDEAEVSGLAIHAAILSGTVTNTHLDEMMLFGIAPLSIGIETAGGIMHKVLGRNTTIPTKKTETFSWFVRDGRLAVLQSPFPSNKDETQPRQAITRPSILVFEGERARTKDNRLLGEIDVSSILPATIDSNFRFDVTIDINPHHKLGVTVQEPASKHSTYLELNTNGRLQKHEIEKMKANLARYKAQDLAEAARVSERCALDDRIAAFRDSVSVLDPAPESLLKAIEDMSIWVDDNQCASIEEYRAKYKELDALEDVKEEDHPFATSRNSRTTDDDPWNQLGHFASRKTDELETQSRTNALDGSLGVAVDSSLGTGDQDQEPTVRPSNRRDKAAPKTPDMNNNIKEQGSGSSGIEPGSNVPSSVSSSSDLGLDSIFPPSRQMTDKPYTDVDFERISTYLRNTGRATWSNTPRLYTVLRLIGQLDALEIFIQHGLTDMWFPFTSNTLPGSLQPSVQSRFLEIQRVAYSQSKSIQLENGERRHAHFSKSDPLPFLVIAKLGRGAHGSVDKVMSTLSHKEYARKLFKKSRGLRTEDVQTFRNELKVLKRVRHKHCVALVATYSDPKNFALLMEPVGDYNLAEYYDKVSNQPDKLSIMRGFFGCLASAMQYLHASEIRHRDIKPQNVIVKGDQVFLADFGIAHSWESLTRATTTADSGKTVVYAAPEVVRVEPRNTAADIWSLGCVFFEMATVLKGKTVQDLKNYFMEQAESRSFYANIGSIPTWIDNLRTSPPAVDNITFDWAMRMLQDNPRERPTAAALFGEIVRESACRGVLFCGTCCHGGAESTTDSEEEDAQLWGDDDE